MVSSGLIIQLSSAKPATAVPRENDAILTAIRAVLA